MEKGTASQVCKIKCYVAKLDPSYDNTVIYLQLHHLLQVHLLNYRIYSKSPRKVSGKAPIEEKVRNVHKYCNYVHEIMWVYQRTFF